MTILNSDDTALTWNSAELGNLLSSSRKSGRVIWMKSIAESTLISEMGRLRERAADLGLLVFALNPESSTREEQTISGVLDSYLRKVERREGLDDETIRLAELLHVGEHSHPRDPVPAGRLKSDTVGRLWTRLSQQIPAVLVALHVDQSRPSDLEELRHLARYVFSDPIEALTPEMSPEHQAHGALVLLDTGARALDVDRLPSLAEIDFDDASKEAVRSFLGREDVIGRFLETSGGDIQRLTDLIENLPATTEHLQLRRYAALDEHQRTILDLLAIAHQSLSPDRIQEALDELGVQGTSATALRELSSSNLIQKNVGAGEIRIRLMDSDLGEAIRHQLEIQARRSLHRALALAEDRLTEGQPDAPFLARHYLAAEELAQGVAFGLQATQVLIAEAAYEEALDIIDRVSSVLHKESIEEGESLQLNLLAAEAASGAGQHKRALQHLTMARQLTNDVPTICQVDVQIGHVSNRLSQFEDAIKHFEGVLSEDCAFAVCSDARIGRSEAWYSIGKHDRLVEDLEGLVVTLVEREGQDHTTDLHLVRARNLIGKVAIFRAQYDNATDLFESNRGLASKWGWDDEVARAQANLGVVALQRREHGEALERLNQALSAAGLRGSLSRAYCLVNLATVHQRQQNYSKALEACLEALRSSKTAGDDVAYGVAAHNLATIYQDLGAFERGRAIIDHLHERYEPEHRTLSSRWNRLVHGDLYLEAGMHERAIAIFEELVDLDDVAGLIYGPEALIRLAQAHLAVGHVERAREIMQQFQIGEENGDRELLELLIKLHDAEFALREGDFAEAVKLATSVRPELVSAGSQNDPARAALIAAAAWVELGREDDARKILETQANDIAEFAGRVPDSFKASFYAKPFNQEVIRKLRELEGDVPAELTRAPQVHEKTEVDEAQVATWRERYGKIVGEDSKLHHIFRMIDRVAPSDATVLVYGESGTGKELISEAIHEQSGRSSRNFVKVNCAAFVENLLLSELFGHEKGAFTGAVSQKIGRFERADGGTIFLDEIGDISPNTQVALLRVLQEGTFERVGGSETIDVDVRVVCATNRNLEELVKRGEFRLDLYYRLKGVVIDTPALRERRQDIPRLVRHFARKFADTTKQFSPEVIRFLASYSWPGNIRELQNFVKSVLLFVEGPVVEMRHVEDFKEFFISGEFDTDLPEIDVEVLDLAPVENLTAESGTRGQTYADPESALVEKIVREGMSISDLKKRLEIESIRQALVESEGNVTRAAEMLQMKRPRLSQIINGDNELTELKAELVS